MTEKMSVSKARNILHGRKINYWKMYHDKYINHSDDRVVAEYNTAEMYELEAEDYEDNLEIIECDPTVIAINCNTYGYTYITIKKDDLIIPP